jgi:peroxiredoxin
MNRYFLNIALLFLPILGMPLSAYCFSGSGTVNNFKLKNVDGRYVSLTDYPDVRGFIIVFTCNHCPFAKLYPGRLNELNTKYKAKGVPLIAISSTDTVIYDDDGYPKMVTKARKEQFNFPYLYDNMQEVARNFGAQKTPHAFVIWKENGKWVVKYNGGIDDNGAEPKKVIHKYVAEAVDALLGGRDVAVKETKSIGCKINLRN